MDAHTTAALNQGGIADISTIGAKSGSERRIEIVFHHLDGRYYITGRPGTKRDWLANMIANPTFTLHLKRSVSADLPVVARQVEDEGERSTVLYRILTESWGNEPAKADHILPRWVDGAPLIEFTPA
ncbi:MAG: nitroreductase/quinone reductase family protein [Acidimicrobiia bacterium]|nr:nitroreductase/quinone reductase family protein [Acidimicrobiia bacterium]